MAVTISTLTFVTRQRQDRRDLLAKQRQDKRDLFLRIHERLVDPDIQLGRRLLYDRVHSVKDAEYLSLHDAGDYQSINRAIAMFDIFAMYVHHDYIDRSVALEEWAHSFGRLWRQAQPFIEDRAQVQSWTSWPHFRKFGPVAEQWHNANSQRA